MPDKRTGSRPTSASRQRRQQQQTHRRSSSLDGQRKGHRTLPKGSYDVISAIDLRTPKQKIEDLENDMRETQNEPDPQQYFNQLVLMQAYAIIESGSDSLENARASINLSKFYLNHKSNLLFQAYQHGSTARTIIESLEIRPDDDNVKQNTLACDIYLTIAKCLLYAKQYSLRRDLKVKNKKILSMNDAHLGKSLPLVEQYLEKLKYLLKSKPYEKIRMDYLFVKFDYILLNSKDIDESIFELIDELITYIEKYSVNNQVKRKIDLYQRAGSFLINNKKYIQDGLKFYRLAFELAQEQERIQSSETNKHQLANTILQLNVARMRTDRLMGEIERDLQRAVQLYKGSDNSNNKKSLKALDELANYYIKLEQRQDALNILCENLPDKIRLFGDFSEEVIQTESLIGAIYLQESEYLNAAEHLKACLDLQEFVYGPNDSRTCETRNYIETLKKIPMYSQTRDAMRQQRPAFRVGNKISHKEEDAQLLQTAARKPPMGNKT